MECPLGDIDLNREHMDTLPDIETHGEDHGRTEGLDVPQEGAGSGMVDVTEATAVAEIQQVPEKVPEQSKQKHEEPEEGEISDDNEQVIENPQSDDKIGSAGRNESTAQKKESSPAVPKTAVTPHIRWAGRSNGDGRQGGWSWHSEASSFPAQADKFFQFAWAKGVQGSPKESVGDSPQEEILKDSLMKAKKTGDSDAVSTVPLHRSASWSGNKDFEHPAERKSAWIFGDRGIEFVHFLRSDDGYLYLQEGGDRSDQRRGESWKGRGDKGSSERTSMSKSMVEKSGREVEEKYKNQSEERTSVQEKEHRRRSDAGRSTKDSRKRDNRGEGELEEGEIEGKQVVLAEKAAMELALDKQGRYSKGRDRQVGKPLERLSSLSNLKGRRDYDTSGHHSTMPESHKDKLFTECAELVRNVAVKDAEKSFIGVCRQLRRALKILRDLNRHSEGHQRKVFALTRDAFSGIRAAYVVWNAAISKEQEQDTDAFPRLLELASSRCQSLFTSKQIQELESMMQAIGCRSRVDHIQKAYVRRFSSFEAERGEEKDLRFGESSGNTSATTQLESESTTDTSAKGRTLDLEDEVEQSSNPSAHLHIVGGIPVDQTVNLVDNSTAGNIGFGGWFSLSPEQGEVQGYVDVKEIGSISSPMAGNMVDFQDNQRKSYPAHTSGAGADGKRGMGNSSEFLSHMDPVRALTSYHEKFAGKSQMVYTRLPSPTPSDEDEEATTNSGIEISGFAANLDSREGQQGGKEAQVLGLSQDTQPSFFHSVGNPQQEPFFTVRENHGRSIPPELRLFPSSEPPVVEDGVSEGLQAKLMPLRGPKKSRDPRRRLASQPFDLDLSQLDNSGNEGSARSQWSHEGVRKLSSETAGPKQQGLQTDQENSLPKGELVSLLTLATGGGWLPEQQMAPSVSEVPADMDADDEGLRISLDPANNFFDDVSQKKRQFDFLSQEMSSKRQKFSALAKEGDDLPHPKGLLDLQTSLAAVSSDDTKGGVLDENLSVQTRTLSKQSAPAMVKDSSKPRMKPRDPRRVLLGSTLEKSKNLDQVLAKGNSTVAATGPGASSLAAQTNVEAVATTSPTPSTHNPTEKLIGVANMAVNAWTSSATKNETSPAIEGNSLPQDTDSSGSNSRPEDLIRVSKAVGISTKVLVNDPTSKLDLNVSAAAPSKQRENINHWDHLEPLLEGLDEKQKQAVRQERARRIEEQSRMFVARKLCLVLDLDHTLLNSAKFTEIEEEWEAKLRTNEATERNKFSKEGSSKRELYRFNHMGMWTKLRPGIWNFLARASHLYELHVYTMGNKAYATEMAKLLDPTGALFAGRVISKGDDGDVVDGDERPPKSKDLDGVLGMESAVVIIDDSARVWPHHRHNLIVVERYMYFPCSRKQFGLPGPSLLEVGHDEREQDGMLASALMVIEKIHYNFFSNPRLHEVDVRDILAKEQRRVLAGCKLIFSRVFPQGEIQPHLHPLWQLAEQFGAVCSIGMDDGVTHVVAISLGTDKVNWALSSGRFVVRPSWLEASAILYRRANERDFSVPP